jgi:hypothetical protein
LHSLAQGQKLVEQTPNPLWKLPEGDSFADSAATFFKSNLYLYIDHAIVTNVSNRWMVAENDGYHAKLICLSRDLHEPIVVPLKFDLERGRPPLKSLGQGHFLLPWEKACSTWMHFAGDTLYISQPDTPGIWGIPVSEVEAAVTAQKALLLKKAAQVSNKTQNGKTP